MVTPVDETPEDTARRLGAFLDAPPRQENREPPREPQMTWGFQQYDLPVYDMGNGTFRAPLAKCRYCMSLIAPVAEDQYFHAQKCPGLPVHMGA
jgi:hypothetical protein